MCIHIYIYIYMFCVFDEHALSRFHFFLHFSDLKRASEASEEVQSSSDRRASIGAFIGRLGASQGRLRASQGVSRASRGRFEGVLKASKSAEARHWRLKLFSDVDDAARRAKEAKKYIKKTKKRTQLLTKARAYALRRD